MNPENPSAVINPPPETPPSPGRPAETEEARRKKPGIFRAWFDLWRDRDLNLEGRDTSDWNIYYYYFRQVSQHCASIKLKHMKWVALLFQLYFFGMILLAQLRLLLFLGNEPGKLPDDAFSKLISEAISMLGVSVNIFIMPLLLFIPVIMVGATFMLRARPQGFMTSRAKEPPLLAHLVQYTTNKGLVQGALQSLLFAWSRLILLLLPAIVVAVLLLACYVVFEHSDNALKLAIGLPVGATMAVLTVSMFFIMQPFCYRLDSLMFIVGIGMETFLFTALGFNDRHTMEFWVALMGCYVPSCLLACAYFPLAAADTGEYGLGKNASKWIRILLFSLAGVFLLTLLATNAIPACRDGSLSFRETFGGYVSLAESDKSILFRHREFIEILFQVFKWGLFLSVCGLLVSSISVTSLLADRQRQLRARKPFLREMFDPASPVSLIPIIVLELIVLLTVPAWTEPFRRYMSFRISSWSWTLPVRVIWTAIHFGLVFAYVRQRRKPEMKDPWNFNVSFNMACIIGIVAVALILVLSEDAAMGLSIGLYAVSIIVLGIFCQSYFRAGKKAPSDGVPTAEQNKEAS